MFYNKLSTELLLSKPVELTLMMASGPLKPGTFSPKINLSCDTRM